MYVTDVPVADRLTSTEPDGFERGRERIGDIALDVHLWAARHTGRDYSTTL